MVMDEGEQYGSCCNNPAASRVSQLRTLQCRVEESGGLKGGFGNSTVPGHGERG